jgi:hypothetical protein
MRVFEPSDFLKNRGKPARPIARKVRIPEDALLNLGEKFFKQF